MRRAAILLALLVWPAQAVAEDPPLPQPRPTSVASGSSVPTPRERPTVSMPAETPPAREAPAPPRDYQTTCPAVLSGEVEATPLPPISAKQCGLRSPLKVTGVTANGRLVPLSVPATLDCGMASALPGWLSDVDAYARGHDGSGIAGVEVSTSYACRNVDNAATGNLSFHALGDALDVTGLSLEDGREVTIAGSWNATPEDGRDVIRFAHDAACSHFTTVLGPDADRFHQDNLHLDLGCHGRRCTYRICQ